MLMNPYTNFTKFEKGALCAFGSTDKKITIENMNTLATMAVHKKTAAQFDRLINKLRNEVFPHYQYDEVFYACAVELEDNHVLETLAYQNSTGDVTTGRPWKNYGKAALINEFCDDDPYTTIGRLLFVREAGTKPEVRTLVEEIQREVERFYCVEMDAFFGYDKWLAWHRGVVHNGVTRKKKGGETQFLNFKWSVPVYDSDEAYLIEEPFISGDFLNSVPDAMDMFVPEMASEIENKIKADQESGYPSPGKRINFSITTEQLVRLVNGIKETRLKKA
ncbi:MAG: hypothetical protein LUD82_06620 [Clostridiales bacterium]|nr:hypothetical protein [Clostridiales bacterium]